MGFKLERVWMSLCSSWSWNGRGRSQHALSWVSRSVRAQSCRSVTHAPSLLSVRPVRFSPFGQRRLFVQPGSLMRILRAVSSSSLRPGRSQKEEEAGGGGKKIFMRKVFIGGQPEDTQHIFQRARVKCSLCTRTVALHPQCVSPFHRERTWMCCFVHLGLELKSAWQCGAKFKRSTAKENRAYMATLPSGILVMQLACRNLLASLTLHIVRQARCWELRKNTPWPWRMQRSSTGISYNSVLLTWWGREMRISLLSSSIVGYLQTTLQV